jgi:hypothetical protein
MRMGRRGFEMRSGGALGGEAVVEGQVQEGQAAAAAQDHGGQQARPQAGQPRNLHPSNISPVPWRDLFSGQDTGDNNKLL